VDQLNQAHWRRTGRQVFWIAGVVIAVPAVLFVINRFFVHRPLWDWLELLIVPAVLAGGGLWFNAQQRDREQRIANERAQDEALQAYLVGMSELLTDKEQPLHRTRPGDRLSAVARAWTLTVLPRLNSDRKARVVQFLYESGLIVKDAPVLNLFEADLRKANLRFANLRGAYLLGVDLRGASLRNANLSDANLNIADLRGANLFQASLSSANLFRASLSSANLLLATLSSADLRKTDLRGAYLQGANLSNVRGVTMEQLEQAEDLEGATMPNGQKYEDWLKSKDSGEE